MVSQAPRSSVIDVPARSFRPNEVSAGGVVVRHGAGGYEVCLINDGRYWGLPKGNVERGESPAQTALREIAEETGLPLSALTVTGDLPASEYVYRRDGRLIFKRVHHFLVTLHGTASLHAQQSEVVEARWLSFADAIERATFRDTVTALQEAQRILGAQQPA